MVASKLQSRPGVWAFDLEANGFLDEADTIWCIAVRSMDTRDEHFFGPDKIREGVQFLTECEILVAHNGFGYDYPLLRDLYGFTHPSLEDSLVLSRLYNPDRLGGHSIEAWGKKFGIDKPAHEDWSQYSDEMGHRCTEDTRILTRVVRQLIDESKGQDWRDIIELEYAMSEQQARIEKRGVLLDVEAAEQLERDLITEIDIQATKLEAVLPFLAKPLTATDASEGGGVKKPFKANGEMSKAAIDWLGEDYDSEQIGGPFSRVVWEQLDYNSAHQVKPWLLSLGWIPDDFNFKKSKDGFGYEKNPDGSYVVSSFKITQSSLESLEDPIGLEYRKYAVAIHRKTLVKHVTAQKKHTGWLNIVRPDNTVSAVAISLGTATHRYAHKNIVNVPSVDAAWGERLRSCLIARPGYVFAGTDAKGFQNRIAAALAWPYDQGEYAEIVLGDGDIHLKNRLSFEKILGRMLVDGDVKKSRAIAKNIGYALMFGGGAGKIAAMLKCDSKTAQGVIDVYWKNAAGLEVVKNQCVDGARFRGHIIGLDGRVLPTRSPHSSLNTKIQSEEAIFMKIAMRLIQEWGDANDGHIVMHMHDEWLMEIPDTDESRAAYEAEVIRIGQVLTSLYEYKVDVEFSNEFGNNYAEVH